MEYYVELKQMKPKAEIIMGRVRINEYDDTVEMFNFSLADGIPWLPICDQLIEEMKKIVSTFESNKAIPDKQDRYNANVEAKRNLWKFAAQVESELNQAVFGKK